MSANLGNNPDGVKRAALVLLSLSPNFVSRILARLTRRETRSLSTLVATLEMTDPTVASIRQDTLDDFYFLYKAWEHLNIGERAYAIDLLRKTNPQSEAEWMVQKIEAKQTEQHAEVAQSTALDRLVNFIRDEADAVIGLILGYLQPHRAAEVFEQLDEEKQIAVLRYLVDAEKTEISRELLNHTLNMLRIKLSDFRDHDEPPHVGADAAADILGCFQLSREVEMLQRIRQADPELGTVLAAKTLTFADLGSFGLARLSEILSTVDSEVLAIAMFGVTEELTAIFFAVMNEDERERIERHHAILRPTLEEIDDARNEILGIARKLPEVAEWLDRLRNEDEMETTADVLNRIVLDPDRVTSVLRFWMND